MRLGLAAESWAKIARDMLERCGYDSTKTLLDPPV
jgi:hypothetical protein